jgi:uncharacterized FlaG/YvyC family protein
MEINSVNRGTEAVPAVAVTVPTDRAAQNRDVVQAVKALNATEMFGQDNELLFQRDSLTKRMVVRVINRQTKDVVSQIPPEYVLCLAANVKGDGDTST